MKDNARNRSASRRRRSIRKIRYTNHSRVLLCYLLVWGIVALYAAACFTWVYPRHLTNSSPDIVLRLSGLWPSIADRLRLAPTDTGPAATALQFRVNMQNRELYWQLFIGIMMALAYGLTLLVQLIWRWRWHHLGARVRASRTAPRAIRWYRVAMAIIICINAGLAYAVYALGVSDIRYRTVWDWAMYMGLFALTPLAAWACFRLAAPAGLSGKHCFFHRL